MNIDRNTTVGKIATEYPAATRVFDRHGIDFCCGGGKPLADACGATDVDTVLAEIEKEISGSTAAPERFDDAPLDRLIEHIIDTYHKPLAAELPRLEQMTAKVLDVHGEKNPKMFSEVHSTFLQLKAELDKHMMKEEQILFPMILSGQGAMAHGPITVMEREHESAGDALRHLRQLTGDYNVPEEACNTWRALWHGLAELETALHEHIHLENNILFPRALSGEA